MPISLVRLCPTTLPGNPEPWTGVARYVSLRRKGDCGRRLPSLGCDGPRLSASGVDWDSCVDSLAWWSQCVLATRRCGIQEEWGLGMLLFPGQ